MSHKLFISNAKVKILFYHSHKSPLYPDALKIKTRILVKQKCHLFYKFTNPFLGYSVWLGRPGSGVARNGFVKKKFGIFVYLTIIIVFIFKTPGYNGQ
jgi:hypothetical protein